MNPAQGNAQAQPEVVDIQQRMRLGTDALFKDMIIAGAGPYQGPVTGSLVNFFASVLPRRTGDLSPDPTTGPGSFTTDKITLTYIPNSYSQTTLSAAMPSQSAELKVTDQPNCPKGEELCGFKEGMDVIIFDMSGNYDTFTITEVQDPAAHLQHRGQDLNYSYGVGASVTQVVSDTFYLNRATNQLMQYDGHLKETPLVDNVVDLRFDYFGDTVGPTQPKPPLGVANCLYDAAGNFLARPTLAATEGSLAALTSAMLSDGPYCGAGDNQFDVDLLRVRKVQGDSSHAGGIREPARQRPDPFQEPGDRRRWRPLRPRLPDAVRSDAAQFEPDTIMQITHRLRTRLSDQQGSALIIALMAMMLLTALGAAVVMVSTTETRISGNYRDSQEALYAADAAVERVVQDLLLIPRWNDILNGTSQSDFTTGAMTAAITLPAGRTMTLCCGANTATGQLQTDTDTLNLWGPNNPQWKLFAWGPARHHAAEQPDRQPDVRGGLDR